MSRRWSWLVATFFLLSSAAPAFAVSLTLDFEEFAHGEIVGISQGVHIDVGNANPNSGHPDYGVAFDTLEPATEDPDLEMGSGWAVGNLAGNNVLNNILIIQENDDCGGGFCNDPDDEARRPAGTISFDFTDLGVLSDFSFDLIDVESETLEAGYVQFLIGGVGGSEVAYFTFASFLGLGQDVVYGNGSANHIDLGDLADFDAVVIGMGGSGGIDNLESTNVALNSPIPEPSSAALCILGLTGLAVVGRRRDGVPAGTAKL